MRLRYLLYYIVCAFAFVSCNSSEDNSKATDPDKNVVLSEESLRVGIPEKLDYLIKSLTISDDMISLLAVSDNNLFDASLLNSSSNVKQYTTSRSKAVNMGVYGAELNYLIHFGQTEQSMKYMLVSKQIANQIGVAMAFDQQTVEEYQNNVDNKDSLINIIFVAYDNARQMLKNEDQFMLSSLVIVGSWIENMYITTELFGKIKSPSVKSKLVTSIIEQKDYLNKMLETVVLLDEGDNVFVSDLIESLKTIETVYGGLGEKLLSESDVQVLRGEILKARNKIVQVK